MIEAVINPHFSISDETVDSVCSEIVQSINPEPSLDCAKHPVQKYTVKQVPREFLTSQSC